MPDSISVESRIIPWWVSAAVDSSVFEFGAADGSPFGNRTGGLNNKQEAHGMCVAKCHGRCVREISGDVGHEATTYVIWEAKNRHSVSSKHLDNVLSGRLAYFHGYDLIRRVHFLWRIKWIEAAIVGMSLRYEYSCEKGLLQVTQVPSNQLKILPGSTCEVWPNSTGRRMQKVTECDGRSS